MLQKLYIRNYAIIDELTLDFDPTMNVITGETGAGKSIILGALSLILGERADTSVLINRNEKSIVEAVFHTKDNAAFNRLLQAADLDVEDHTIIRREINPGGKSRAFINDTPVTLSVLNQLSSVLVELHRQFDLHAIEQQDFLYDVIDAVADTLEERHRYRQLFQDYKNDLNTYQQLSVSQQQWQKEADYKQFLLEELEQANLSPDELETAATTLKQLGHAEQIMSSLNLVYHGLETAEQPLNQELKRMLQQLQGLSSVLPEADGLAQRMESALLELEDIAAETLSLQEKVEMDPAQLQLLQERIDMGYRLLKKHGLNTTTELLQLQEQLQQELNERSGVTEQLAALQKTIDQQEQELRRVAGTLSKHRSKALPVFEQQINNLLKGIGMPDALLRITLTATSTLHEQGTDELHFLLDANKSGNFQAVQKAASGGELSRIMLCIKALTAKALHLPTLIFDEIDTGISGEAAQQVGLLLQDLGQYHQVVCITHLPQVAGKGSKHFFVFKSAGEGTEQIKTRLRVLNAEERVTIIAQMIGGDQPSRAAIEHAREMVRTPSGIA